jgi:hypothetical protein
VQTEQLKGKQGTINSLYRKKGGMSKLNPKEFVTSDVDKFRKMMQAQ